MKTQEKAQHTPTPWHVEVIRGCWKVLGSHGDVAFDDGSAYGEYADACKPETRDFIVRAVNSFDLRSNGLELIASHLRNLKNSLKNEGFPTDAAIALKIAENLL